jgi:hypothetical protein
MMDFKIDTSQCASTNQLQTSKERTNQMTHSELIQKTMGSSAPNMNHDTDIHFGVIPQNSVSGDAIGDIWSNGDNLTYQSAVEEMKADIQRIVGSTDDTAEEISELLQHWFKTSYIDWDENIDDILTSEEPTETKVSEIWDAIEQTVNDRYESDCDTYRYESDGYTIETSETDLFITDSPFYTLCGQCSPCAPNAGYLTSRSDAMKAYCLGADWFDTYAPLPYDVYSVATDELISRAHTTDTEADTDGSTEETV